MLSVEIFSAGEPPFFNVSTENPDYWVLRLHYELSVNLHNMAAEGFVLSQAEEEEFEYESPLAALNAINESIQDVAAGENLVEFNGFEVYEKSRMVGGL